MKMYEMKNEYKMQKSMENLLKPFQFYYYYFFFIN